MKTIQKQLIVILVLFGVLAPPGIGMVSEVKADTIHNVTQFQKTYYADGFIYGHRMVLKIIHQYIGSPSGPYVNTIVTMMYQAAGVPGLSTHREGYIKKNSFTLISFHSHVWTPVVVYTYQGKMKDGDVVHFHNQRYAEFLYVVWIGRIASTNDYVIINR